MDQPGNFDVCIVGAGPAGLAALSACVEPYSLDLLGPNQSARVAHALGLQQKRNAAGSLPAPRVCVIDSEPWLTAWRQRFQHVDIQWLRSPTIAHPDAFDPGAMLAFAGENDRTKELLDSGCVDKNLLKLPEASAGFWHLPSNKLFLDFCDDLVSRSPHKFVKGRANSIQGVDGEFTVGLEDGRELKSASVVLALGVPGPPVIPASIANLPSRLMFHSDFESGRRLKELGQGGARRILVLGGGLTAVQVALLGVKRGCTVTLCSRRPLTTRHFDIDKSWFDWREGTRHRFGFLSKPLEERLAMIKETRGGGSVPPFYMNQLRQAGSSGRLTVKVCEVQVSKVLDNGVDVEVGGSIERFDLVVSACGHRPDCTQLPLIQALLKDSPVQITGGLPHLSQDLEWGEYKQLKVIGSLASLQVGPDAGNLMGIRRAALILTSTMGLRDWLHEFSEIDETSLKRNIRGNSFSLLDDHDQESEEGSEEELVKDEIEEMQAGVKMVQNQSVSSKRRLGKRRGKKTTSRRK